MMRFNWVKKVFNSVEHFFMAIQISPLAVVVEEDRRFSLHETALSLRHVDTPLSF